MFEELDNLLLVHVFVSHRIDHLLGKDLIENLTVLRFSNLVFEPLWSRTYIRNVQVHFKAHFDICFTICIYIDRVVMCGNFYRLFFLKKQQLKYKGGELMLWHCSYHYSMMQNIHGIIDIMFNTCLCMIDSSLGLFNLYNGLSTGFVYLHNCLFSLFSFSLLKIYSYFDIVNFVIHSHMPLQVLRKLWDNS